jgi:hypothetical protein
MSTIAKTWFEECKKLEMDCAIFLRVATKTEQIELCNALTKERENYAEFDPVHASQLFINRTLKDRKQYVVVERKFRTPFTAFFKDKDGNMSKIHTDPERRRIIKLMVKDKMTRDEIEDTLNGLTEEEVEEFYGE